MAMIETKDGTTLYYNDWGTGQPIVFSHGWPLSADAFEDQMFFLASRGYRCIAHDRRGHGRSTQTGDGHDMDHYADDLAAVTRHLDLKDVIHIGHSTGGGEVVHYLARHGEDRVAKAAIISAVPPLMVKTDANPNGLPKAVFATGASSTTIFPPGRFTASTVQGSKPSNLWSGTGGARG